MAFYDAGFKSIFSRPNIGQQSTLNLPPAPGANPCGPCAGTAKYNMQLDGNCDFSGSRPFGPPSENLFSKLPGPQSGYTPDTGYLYGQPTPVSKTTEKPVGPSTIPQIVGQFFDKYLNPDTHVPPIQPQTGSNPFGKPCPRVPNRPVTTKPQPIPSPSPTPLQRPQPGNCFNPCEDTWNNTGSKRLPQQIMCASGNMYCQPQPFQPQFVQPNYVPPILQSGKLRDAVTPDDICVPDGSPVGYHYEQRYPISKPTSFQGAQFPF